MKRPLAALIALLAAAALTSASAAQVPHQPPHPDDVHGATIYSTGQLLENHAPEMWFNGQNGSWGIGVDSAAPVPGRDFVIGFLADGACCSVADFMYFRREGAHGSEPTLGVGWTVPPENARLNVGATGPVGGVQVLQRHDDDQGNPLAIVGGNMQDRWHMGPDLWMSPTKVEELLLGSAASPYRLGLEWGDGLVLRDGQTPVFRVHEDGEFLLWRDGTWRQVAVRADVAAALAPMRDAIAAADSDRAALRDVVAALAPMRDAIAVADSDRAALRDGVEVLGKKVAEQAERSSSLEARNAALEKRADSLEEAAAARDRKLDEQRERITALEARLSASASETDSLRQQLGAFYGTLAERDHALARCIAIRNDARRARCARQVLG